MRSHAFTICPLTRTVTWSFHMKYTAECRLWTGILKERKLKVIFNQGSLLALHRVVLHVLYIIRTFGSFFIWSKIFGFESSWPRPYVKRLPFSCTVWACRPADLHLFSKVSNQTCDLSADPDEVPKLRYLYFSEITKFKIFPVTVHIAMPLKEKHDSLQTFIVHLQYTKNKTK